MAADTTEAEQPAPVEPRETAAVGGLGPTSPVVVIDDDLRGLEWVKGALSSSFQRVHIFQRSELGLTRIRQYLARIETPLVLVSPAIAGDPLSGIRDSADFVRRLKIQSSRMPVFWLCEEGVEPPPKGSADGAVTRPAAQKLRDQSAEPELAEALRRTLSG